MKQAGKYLFYAFLCFALFGAWTTVQEGKGKVENKTFLEMKEVIEKKNDNALFILEQREDGLLILDTKDKKMVTQVNPNFDAFKEFGDEKNLTYRYVKEENLFSWLIKWTLPILLLLFIVGWVTKSKNQATALPGKKGIVQTEKPKTVLSDIGGISDETRKEIHQIIEIFQNKQEAESLGIRPAKGVLLYGPPGTGKTLLAKAMANALGASFYSVSGSNFVEMFVGVGAKRVRDLFEEARKTKPSLIFIDEIDSVAKKRGMGLSNEERESTLNELLKQLDGVESNEDIFVIAATNRMDTLDAALIRPGRFDYKLYIGLPDLEGRKEIVRIHSANKNLDKDLEENLHAVAEGTTGFSGAEIENLFNVAAKRALSEKRKSIGMDDIHYAIDMAILGNQSRKMTDEGTKRRVAYHEAGHALVGLVTKPKSVRKATIIPRGHALGFVAPNPKEMELLTPSELMNQVAMILAGGAAEMKIFGEHSIGVSGDVEQAMNVIDQMVNLGMGEDGYHLLFNEKDKEKAKKTLFEKARSLCIQVLNEHELALNRLAEELLKTETLDGEAIEKLINM